MESRDEPDQVDEPDEVEPLAVAPAFEHSGFLVSRLVRGMQEGFSPRLTARSFAESDRWGMPIVFALLTFVPLTLLQGIIPFTHTLRFGDVFSVEVLESTMTIGSDIAHASGIALLVTGIELFFFAASYVSLANAYGEAPEGAATDEVRLIALRAVLYRAWWLPMQGVLGLPVMLLMWALPKESAGSFVFFIVLMLGVIPLVLHFVAMRQAARQSCGVSDGASLIVVIVPFILMIVVHYIFLGDGVSGGLLADWLPTPVVEPQ